MRHPTSCVLALWVVLAAAVPSSVAANDPVPAAAPLRYRRVLVPREALAELTRGYLPMKRVEFATRMVEFAAAARAPDLGAAWVASGEYTARFDGGQLVGGVARLQVVHAAAEPALVSLAPAKLAMGPAVWLQRPAPRAATVGADSAGNEFVQVTESGVLEYAWTLGGVANERGEYRFAVALTAAPINRLTLDLPDTYELLSDHGLLVAVESVPPAPDAAADTPTGLRRWTIELGGNAQLEVTVAPRESSSRRRQLVGVEQHTQYHLEADSVQVESTFDLDAHTQPLAELQLDVDDSLQITAVRMDHLDLDWQSVPGGDAGGQVVRIPLAEQQAGTHLTLQITAVAALQTHATWRLPTVRPRQALWRQGTMSLEVPEELELRQLDVHQARQSAVTLRQEEPRSTTLQFELFSADGAIDVALARRTPQVVVEMGATIDMNAGAVTALVIADLRCLEGERFAIDALIPNAWTVDGVEAEPAAAVRDYQFVAYEADFKRLQIQLAQPLQTARALRLTVRLHRSPSLFLGAEDVRPVQWLAMTQATRLVAIVPDANYRLDLSGDAALERLDPAGLSPSDASRLQPRAGSIVFDDNERASLLVVTMTREEPEFAASVIVDVDVAQDTLNESYRVVCTPDTAPLERVRVHFSEPRAADVVWRWVGDGPGILSAQRVRQDEAEKGGVSSREESWEIVLRTPQRLPFELRGQRTTAAAPPYAVSLATLPDAVSHAGQLTLRTKGGQRLLVQAQAVTPIPCDPVPPDTAPTTRACYRYDASKTARVAVERLDGEIGPAMLWAWRCRVLAQVSPTGEVRHTATYDLENLGAADLRLVLPASSTCLGVDIDGAPAPRAVRTDNDGSQFVTLPVGERFPRVEITYVCPGQPLGIWSDVAAMLPQVDVPVLDRRVSLWIPPGYRPLSSSATDVQYPLPTWTQRLLGPLAARRDDSSDPWHARSLWSWLTGPTAPDAAARGAAWVEQLGSVLLAGRREAGREPRTWRAALQECQNVNPGSFAGSVVWVDTEQLTQDGFSLETTLASPQGATEMDTAAAAMRQAGLLLVVHRDKLYLTSRTLAARYPAAGQRLADGTLFVPAAASLLSAELDRLASKEGLGPVPLSTWIAVPTLADPPWESHRDEPGWKDGDGLSGRCCEVSPDAATGRATLRIHRPAALWAMGWSLLVGLAGAIGTFGRGWRGLFLFVVLLAVVAVVVPPSLVPLTSSLFLGALVGLLLIAGRGRIVMASPAADDAASSGGAPAVPVVALLVVAVGLALLSVRLATAADGPEDVHPDVEPPVYPLMIPVDDTLTPVGQYDYLPVEFYDALHRLPVTGADRRRGWLATQANYRIAFHARSPRSTLEVTTISAAYQLEVLTAENRLWFPWDGQSKDVALLEARWNSQPIELEWNAARTAFGVPTPTPGPGILELELKAEIREEPGARQFRWAIPRIARSQLEITLPAGAPKPSVPSSLGAMQVDAAAGVQQVELGPAEYLELRWPTSSAEETPARPLNVSELLWLKIGPKEAPESVRLTARLQLQPAGQRITELTLCVDGQLKWLPPSDAVDYTVSTTAGEQVGDTRMTLRWQEPRESEITVPLEFELVGASGLGNIPLPRLEAVATRSTQRWLAISVAPQLESTPSSSDLYAPLDSAEFLAAWGESDSAPQFCYRIVAEDPGWTLATRSRQPLTSSRERVDVSVGRDRLDLVLEAELETTNGELFLHRVAVPPTLHVTSAVVLSGEADVAAPVAYDGSGTLTIFLRRGVTGVQYLSLRGFLPQAREADSQRLPSLALRDVTVRNQSVYVYRQPEVQLEVRAPETMARTSGAAEGRYRESYGRLVAAFAAYDGVLSGWDDTTLHIQPNQPKIDARLVIVLQREANAWVAIADLDAHVVGETPGSLDTFRFELPPEWTGPFTLDPSAPHEIRALPGQRRQLVIRPLESVPDRLRLRIRGAVVLGPAERGRTPDILPLDVTNLERFFVLPTRWDQQHIDWDTPGLVEVPLEDVVPSDLADPAAQLAYRVWSKPRAVIRQVRRESGERQIALADVHVRPLAEGRWFGVVSFAIQPAGTSVCTLEIPADSEVVQAEIDGVPAMLVPLSDRRWQVRLISEQLSQQLTVVFRRTAPESVRPATGMLAVPWVTDIAVQTTLWTVYRAADTPWQVAGEAWDRVPAAHQDALRLATTAELVETAADAVLDNPPRDVQAWYTPWAERLAAASARLAHAHAWVDSREGASSAEAADAVLQQQEQIAQRLKVAPTVLDFLRQAERQPQTQDVWAFAAGGRVTARHYAFTGAAPALPRVATPAGAAAWWITLLAASSVMALGGGAWLLTRGGALAHAWQRWPQAIGVSVGVGWWLLARPAILGWLVVALCAWNAVRLPWSARVASAPRATPSDRNSASATAESPAPPPPSS